MMLYSIRLVIQYRGKEPALVMNSSALEVFDLEDNCIFRTPDHILTSLRVDMEVKYDSV